MAYSDKDKQNRFQREWIAKRRALFFAGKACSKCGSTLKLELDHINRSDKISHRIWSLTKSRIELELSKCQIFMSIMSFR